MDKQTHHKDIIAQVTEQFSDIYDGSRQGMYIFLDDHHYSLNDRLLKMLGYSSTQEVMAGRQSFLEKMIKPENQDTIVRAYRQAMEHMVGSQLSLDWVKKDGTTLRTTVIIVPISFDHHLLALHFVEEDKK